MNFEEYRKHGKEMVDYIADYFKNIRSRRVYPSVSPGYLRNALPTSAPLDGEPWDDIFADIERCIMPGVTHWQSPHMHAYFPALNSPASLLGDMLADAINCLGFTWASSPVCTELEMIVMNWLAKMIGLPEQFLHRPGVNDGGGVIQTTASDSTLVSLLAARTRAIRDVQESEPNRSAADINSRLVAYCSDQAHSSVEKAGLIGLVKMRYIESDEEFSMRGEALEEALARDRADGLLPFFVCATLGTTGACSFDNLMEIGPICMKNGLWLHIDAAYAGSAFVCPEFRGWLQGIEYADSFAFNPSKWLMVHFDCTAMWIKSSQALHRTFNVDPLYLKHENSGLAIDFMHWQLPLSKRFRALKLWFVIRNFGISGLQRHIREGVRLAQKFEALVLADPRFEIPATRHLGLVVFRLRGENNSTERLLKKINSRGRVHCVPAALHGKYVIRFSVTSTNTTNEDILKDWAEIRNTANEILLGDNKDSPVRVRVPLADTREKNENFGSSLLLANSPMSPKIVNGSFAAIYDATDVFDECMKNFGQLRVEAKDSPAMRRRIRGILMSGKQFSLDSRMDLVQGYVCCGRLTETSNELPQMKEDDDSMTHFESTLSIDKNDDDYSTYNEISRENTMERSESDEFHDDNDDDDDNNKIKNEIAKVHSVCAIANSNNDSFIKQQDIQGQNLSSMSSGEKGSGVGIPRSETIGAIGHRPYTGGELLTTRIKSNQTIKDDKQQQQQKQQQYDDDNYKNDHDKDGILCQKCGHSLKRQ
ncbi:PREDICTED: histidine decarboxylase [Polistes dominula]|uniref:Histidine decarboxylase n=1 Tax=Polistes dominula TaxID=743375 RepID=A0ABM1J757_POLDO|nr:PREDICTED: histidine decarboxylase [Polistes dominula]